MRRTTRLASLAGEDVTLWRDDEADCLFVAADRKPLSATGSGTDRYDVWMSEPTGAATYFTEGASLAFGWLAPVAGQVEFGGDVQPAEIAYGGDAYVARFPRPVRAGEIPVLFRDAAGEIVARPRPE